MTYIIFFFIITVSFFINRRSLFQYDRSRFSQRKIFCFVSSAILALLLILRNDYFGTDTQNYHYIYDNIEYYYDSMDDISLSSEWGFYSLVYYLKTCGCHFRFLLALSAVLYVASVSYLIYRYSENVAFSYFIFFSYNFWIFNTTMRQCFALSFVIIAVICAIHKKLIPYVVLIFAAILFHATAIVCIPIYYVINVKLNKRSIFVFILVMLSIAISASWIFGYMQELTGKEYEESPTSGYIRSLIMIILVIFAIYNRTRLSVENEYWVKLLLMGLCLQPIAQFNPALFRVNYYFYFFIIILAPNVVRMCGFYYRKLLALFLIIYGIYNFTLGSYRSGIRTFPYVYVWENYFEENRSVKQSDFVR